MISLFVNDYTVDYMVGHNGEVVINNPVSCAVDMNRNAIWYLTLEFPMSEMMGIEPQEEMVIKVDLNFKENQLFRVIYRQENWAKHTYTLYANHIFFDSQKEVYVVDKEGALMDWESVTWDVNFVIQLAEPNYAYNVVGKQGYDYFSMNSVEEGRPYFLMDGYASSGNIASNGVVDVPGQNMSTCALEFILLNTTLAQQFVFEKYDDTYYIIKNQKSGLVWDVYGASAYNGCPIYQDVWNGGDNQLWKVETLYENGAWRRMFKSKLNESYCACHASKYISSDNYPSGTITLYKMTDQIPSRYTWITLDKRAVSSFHWSEMNVIEIMFGTNENSLVNCWEECEDEHVTAMFDNLTCYFGAEIEDVEWVQPTTYKIKVSKEKLDMVQKVTVEDVITGIIPKGYNNRMLPDDEIVKSDLWDTYRVHRVKESTYSEVVLLADKADADYFTEDVYETEEQFYTALRNKATEELNRKSLRNPTKDIQIKTEYLFADEQIAKNIKLNDILYIGDEYGFYFNSMKYDVITGRVTDVSLEQIKE